MDRPSPEGDAKVKSFSKGMGYPPPPSREIILAWDSPENR